MIEEGLVTRAELDEAILGEQGAMGLIALARPQAVDRDAGGLGGGPRGRDKEVFVGSVEVV